MAATTTESEFLVMLVLIAATFLALTLYWRTPESGGGPQICVRPPCVEVTLPWATR